MSATSSLLSLAYASLPSSPGSYRARNLPCLGNCTRTSLQPGRISIICSTSTDANSTAERLANILAQRIQTTTDAPNKVGKIQAKLLLLMYYLDDMRDSLAKYLPDPRFAGSTQSPFTRLEMTALRKYDHQNLLLLYCLYTILRDVLDVDLQRRSVRSHNFNWGNQAQFHLLFLLAGLHAASDIMVQPGCSNRSRRMASHLHRTHAANPNLAQNTSQLVPLPRPLTPLLNRQLAR